MKRILPLVFLLLLTAPCFGADIAPKFPDQPPLPAPSPTPQPVTKLLAGQSYIVSFDAPFLLVSTDDTVVKITQLKLPMGVFGPFVDQKPGDEDGRSYTTGTVYIVRPLATGSVTLIASTDLSGKSVVKRNLSVDMGTPPTPGPNPNPPTPEDPLTASIQAAYNLDADADKATSLGYLKLVYAGMSVSPMTNLKTNADALAWVKGIVQNQAIDPKTGKPVGFLPPTTPGTQILNVRKAIATDFITSMTAAPTAPLDTTKFMAEIGRIATSLSKVK